jgi:hypothetical protein
LLCQSRAVLPVSTTSRQAVTPRLNGIRRATIVTIVRQGQWTAAPGPRSLRLLGQFLRSTGGCGRNLGAALAGGDPPDAYTDDAVTRGDLG